MLSKKQSDILMMPINSFRLVFFCIIVISLSIAAFFIFLGIKNHNSLLIIVGPLLSITPAIILRFKISLVAKKATMHFSEEFIEIKTADTLNDRFIYSDIKYFSVSKIDIDNASRIKILLKNGTKRQYMFFRQFDDDENVVNNVLLYFSFYNTGKIQEEKIQVLPSFFLTKQGRLLVVVTGFLILAVIIIQVINKPKTTPISVVFALAIYIQVKAIQRSDRKILRKFRDENR